jgi:hypothetical protein
MNEVEAAFSPDGTELYLAVMADIGTDYVAAIAVTRLEDGAWTELEIAPFSDVGLNMDPFVHPDGSKLYFTSTRPLDGATAAAEEEAGPRSNFWVVDREGDGWSEPKPIGPPINGSGNVSAPTQSLGLARCISPDVWMMVGKGYSGLGWWKAYTRNRSDCRTT